MTQFSVELLFRIAIELRICAAFLITEIGVGTHIPLAVRRSGNVCPLVSVEHSKILDNRYDNHRSFMHCRLTRSLACGRRGNCDATFH